MRKVSRELIAAQLFSSEEASRGRQVAGQFWGKTDSLAASASSDSLANAKKDRFAESLTRAKEMILQRADSGNSERLFSLLRQVAGDRERFVIRVDGKIVFLRNSEVEWIEAVGKLSSNPRGAACLFGAQ